jgi:hypothetical protein
VPAAVLMCREDVLHGAHPMRVDDDDGVGLEPVEHLVTEASQTGDETDLVAVVELSAGRFVEHEWVRGW